jgi:hypothetical protein
MPVTFTKTVVALIALIGAQALLAQTPMTHAVPGTTNDPVWQGLIVLDDGRTFVTDGALVIDAALAKPAKLPERKIPGKVMLDYFNATYPDECGLRDLRRASDRAYATPSGIALNSTYVNYLGRTLPSRSTSLRMSAPGRPVLIVVNGKPVGVLMPLSQ